MNSRCLATNAAEPIVPVCWPNHKQNRTGRDYTGSIGAGYLKASTPGTLHGVVISNSSYVASISWVYAPNLITSLDITVFQSNFINFKVIVTYKDLEAVLSSA
jgi:hypothetical protein